MEHTKGKLKVASKNALDIDNKRIAIALYNVGSKDETHANAKRLVKCWNGYDDLVEAMQDALDKISEWTASSCSDAESVLRKALAEAEKD